MKEINKIENLLSMISKDYNFIKVEDKYFSETKYDLVQSFEIGWDNNKKKYYLIFEISKKAFRCLNLKGVTRFDFLVDSKAKKIYVNCK